MRECGDLRVRREEAQHWRNRFIQQIFLSLLRKNIEEKINVIIGAIQSVTVGSHNGQEGAGGEVRGCEDRFEDLLAELLKAHNLRVVFSDPPLPL
ncbi:hypothetical protein EVAR_85446_1 [Eumeta japonica]|uniref:Uncharacterized protein n=1 Tax=Eumeta variegata TaxID=151549 RepID=A0A4C1WJN6_EUMVA|nr:hypothetical protein EVAR_85446_1 [Eumeta japonica]